MGFRPGREGGLWALGALWSPSHGDKPSSAAPRLGPAVSTHVGKLWGPALAIGHKHFSLMLHGPQDCCCFKTFDFFMPMLPSYLPLPNSHEGKCASEGGFAPAKLPLFFLFCLTPPHSPTTYISSSPAKKPY